MLTHYVLMGRPSLEDKKTYSLVNIDSIEVYISNYFINFKGKDKILDLKELSWGKELQLIDA